MGLELAAEHLSNLTYVAGHLNANGADIVREVASASKAFDSGDYRTFGREIGQAGRKILLSKSNVPNLPEFSPSLHQLVNMSAGITQGFFGRGFSIDITSDKKIVTMTVEETSGWDLDDDTDGPTQSKPDDEGKMLKLHVDMHKCVKRNREFFSSAVFGVLYFFAEQDVSDEEADDAIFKIPLFLAS